MALFDENMAIGKSKYLVNLHLHKLKQPSDRVISGGPLNLVHGLIYAQDLMVVESTVQSRADDRFSTLAF